MSHESIYQYIYWDKNCGGDLHTHLRCKKQRRKRYGSYDRRGKLINQVSIDERPVVVDERSREGDWELDTIIGKNRKQAIVSINERVHRLIYFVLGGDQRCRISCQGDHSNSKGKGIAGADSHRRQW